ncbi:hypothetical protein [Nocardia flavorosea]|uniref:Uncharacterized protein n=1 Tax=Nocardia flavorosea TaxID=53429 RepID=A0A846YMJ6_9NOCA|nr:hypothetical protein [Nocardia flavorosea]NKY60327.1 hypothetical protein [Nocardia flavorosea]
MIGKFEANKDLIQELTSSGARRIGNIAGIITGTVAEVTREIGEWVTDAIEMNEAAAAARRDSAPESGRDSTGHAQESGDPATSGTKPEVTSPAADIVDADVVDAEIADPDRPGKHF